MYSNLSKFDHLRGPNQCYDVLICSEDDGDVIIQKTNNAEYWENQTNGCVEYECNNDTGNVWWYIFCNSSDGINRTCMNGQCVTYNSLNERGWIVEIEFDYMNASDLNTTEIMETISAMTNVDVNEIEIGVEMSNERNATFVTIVVNNKRIAQSIVDSLNNCSEWSKS